MSAEWPAPRVCVVGKPKKRQQSHQFGSHLGIPGSICILSFAVSFAATRDFVKDEAIPAIFEAALQSGRLFARVDIFERGNRGAWNICEVKSSTDVKEEHIDDVAFQLHVANEAGLKISRVDIIHINRDYVLKEKGIEPKHYFRRVDVTVEAKKRLHDIPGMIKAFLKVVDEDRAPEIEPWTQCHSPYECEFLDRCTASKPKD